MKKNKLLSFILASLLLMTSCSTTPVETESDNSAGSETIADSNAIISDDVAEEETSALFPPAEHALPDDLDYEGAAFRMLSGDSYDCPSLVEDYNGNILNDAKYSMELTVEELLKVDISETLAPFGDMQNKMRSLVMSGDREYNVYGMEDYFVVQVASNSKLFLPLDTVSHLDLSQPYWGGQISEDLSIGGRQLFAIPSYNLKAYERTAFLFMNKAIATELNLEVPFEDVFAGTWTWDKFLSYDTIAVKDLDGDGFDVNEDQYTYGYIDLKFVAASVWISGDERAVRKDADDIPYVTVFNNEKFYDLLEIAYNTFGAGSVTGGNHFGTQHFTDGRVLFMLGGPGTYDEGLREMDDDFSVLPMPKYDEYQENYKSRTYCPLFCVIPVTVADEEMTGAVLEALACEGYRTVVPAYVETTLQDQYSRDPQTVKSIAIIFDSRTIDIAETYLVNIFGDGIGLKLMQDGQFTPASYFAKRQSATEKSLRLLVDNFLKNNE